MTFVPTDKWPQIRQDFLVAHGYLKGKQKQSPSQHQPKPSQQVAVQEEKKSADNGVVGKAEQLFGSDIVKVEDD